MLDGLDELGHDLGELFGSSTGHVATADDAAHEALTARGLEPRRWVKLGPTSAWEQEPGAVAYDADRWEADDEDGEIVLTNLAERLTPWDRLPHRRAAAASTSPGTSP